VVYISEALQTLSVLNQYSNDNKSRFGSLAVTLIVSVCTGPAIVQLFIVHVGDVLSIQVTVANDSQVLPATS